jgi:hypothetical protein
LGQSGEPGGKPKIHQQISAEYSARLLEQVPLEIAASLGVPEGSNLAAAIARAIVSLAASGDVGAHQTALQPGWRLTGSYRALAWIEMPGREVFSSASSWKCAIAAQSLWVHEVVMRPCCGLSQLSVLSFGLLVDRDVGIGILPQREEILIRLARGRSVAHHHLCAAELQMC